MMFHRRLCVRRRRHFGVGRCGVIKAEVDAASEAACQYQPLGFEVSVSPHLLACIHTPSIIKDISHHTCQVRGVGRRPIRRNSPAPDATATPAQSSPQTTDTPPR